MQQVRTGGGLTTETENYRFDALGRMDAVTLPNGTLRHYVFDRDSNRTQVTENGTTTATYTYDPQNPNSPGVDQLTSATESGQNRTFVYRPDGEMTARGSDTLTWDGWGRLTGGTFGTTTVSYSFDPLGFRRQRVAGGTTTRYLRGGLFETDGSGTITLTDVDGADADLAHFVGPPTSGSTVTYLYYNGHGDLAAEATDLGVRTNAYTYDPFGAPRQAQPQNKAVERFTGRWDKKLDTASNLIEMGARPYDPTLGRFLTVDPVEGGSLNNYDYVGQDPINAFDLSGLVEGCGDEAQCGAPSSTGAGDGEGSGRGGPRRGGRDSVETGEAGELRAMRRLRGAGFRVLARHVTIRTRLGSVRPDIVAVRNGKLYVFEVKPETRRNSTQIRAKSSQRSHALVANSSAAMQGKPDSQDVSSGARFMCYGRHGDCGTSWRAPA